MRRTCADSTPGLRSVPASAARRSGASGMLAHRKYDSRVASSCCVMLRPVAGGTAATVALDAEQEVGRDEQGLDADRQAFLERSLVLLRATRERDVFRDLVGRDRPAERSFGHARQDSRRARRRVLASRARRASESVR